MPSAGLEGVLGYDMLTRGDRVAITGGLGVGFAGRRRRRRLGRPGWRTVDLGPQAYPVRPEVGPHTLTKGRPGTYPGRPFHLYGAWQGVNEGELPHLRNSLRQGSALRVTQVQRRRLRGWSKGRRKPAIAHRPLRLSFWQFTLRAVPNRRRPRGHRCAGLFTLSANARSPSRSCSSSRRSSKSRKLPRRDQSRPQPQPPRLSNSQPQAQQRPGK